MTSAFFPLSSDSFHVLFALWINVFLSFFCHFNGVLGGSGEKCVYAIHHVYINFYKAVTPEVINKPTCVSLIHIWDNSIVS